MSDDQKSAILDIIADAIHKGANAWDAWAMPSTEDESKEALERIMKVLGMS